MLDVTQRLTHALERVRHAGRVLAAAEQPAQLRYDIAVSQPHQQPHLGGAHDIGRDQLGTGQRQIKIIGDDLAFRQRQITIDQ